jgi:putative resolvase
MKLREYANRVGIKYKAAWEHYKKGLIPGAYQIPTGTIVVPNDFFSDVKSKDENVIIYCRVSSSENKSNLDAQADRLMSYCAAKGYKIYKVVKEIGSGINDNRPKLKNILVDDNVTRIVVEHKDRLTRFGFVYLDTLLERLGVEIEIINCCEQPRDDLIQDFVSIITSFCARLYGQRRNKRRTEKLIKELEEKE